MTVFNPPIATKVALANVTLSSNDSQVVFANIPSIYKDLMIVWQGYGTGDENLTPILNGSSSSFSWVQMTANGSTLSSNAGTNNSIGRVGTVNTAGFLHFIDYSATNKNKFFFVRTDLPSSDMRVLAAKWASTAAINSIALSIRTGHSFTTGSIFTLYGIEG